MRVTLGMRDAAARSAATESSERLLTAGNRASTGKRVASPKDDPGAYARIQTQSGGLGVLGARSRAISRAEGELTAAEGALASAADLLKRAREIAVQMADGSISATDRTVAANEVTQLRQSLVGLANTQIGDVFVFGGTATQTPPFSTTGVFLANDNPIELEVADGMRVRANASGAEAFTLAGGRDVFADLDAFATALVANDVVGVQTAIGNLDDGHAQVTKTRADAGVTIDRMRTASTVTSSAEVALRDLRAGEEEADAVQAFADLAKAQAAYERALEITKRMLSTFQADKLIS
jgi:flagellar hook-associated protein 3 FlgL